MQPIYDRRRKKRAKRTVSFALDVTDDPAEKSSLTEKPPAQSSHVLDDDCSVASADLMDYYLDGRLQIYGHEHQQLVNERFCPAWIREREQILNASSEMQSETTSEVAEPMFTADDDSDANLFSDDHSSDEEIIANSIPFPVAQKTMLATTNNPPAVTPSPTPSCRWSELEIHESFYRSTPRAFRPIYHREMDTHDVPMPDASREEENLKTYPNTRYNDTDYVESLPFTVELLLNHL
jgi:hypothetical protein